VRAQALAILTRPELERFFNPAHYRFARNEMDVMGRELWRFDRVVAFDDTVWILDYKRNFLDSERAMYKAQLTRYREAGQAVFAGRTLREQDAAVGIDEGTSSYQKDIQARSLGGNFAAPELIPLQCTALRAR